MYFVVVSVVRHSAVISGGSIMATFLELAVKLGDIQPVAAISGRVLL